MTDPNEQVRTIIETAVDQLVTLGMTRAGAAGLLAVQGVVRLALLPPDPDVRHVLETVITDAQDALESCPVDRLN